VGRVADNLLDQVKHSGIPIVDKFNTWLFSKLSRGAMLQTGIANYERNLARPEFNGDREAAARQTAKEMNEMFGNLQNQGLITSKTMQDVARVLFLAPNWMESQFANELHGYTGLAKTAKDLAMKGQFNLTNQTRAMAKGLFIMLAANQIVNFGTRGTTTFQNPEDGHKLDAWIPGGPRGFFFNPFEIVGEYAHAFLKYLAQGQNPVDAATRIGQNKLSTLGRGVKEAISGRDYAGRKYLSDTQRFQTAAMDALPFPMPLNSVIEKDPNWLDRIKANDPKSWLPFRLTRQSGGVPAAIEKQLLQSSGVKVTAASSPRSLMFQYAKPYRADRMGTDNAGEYTELRRALDDNNTGAVRSEILGLFDRGKTVKQITGAVGMSPNGEIKPEMFAGSKDRERDMLRHLTPDQIKTYQEAQSDHRRNAQRLLPVLNQMHRDREIPASAFKAKGGDFGGAGANS